MSTLPTEKLEGMDVWLYHGQIFIPNTDAAGAVGSKFLIGLRDRKRITGTKCSTCNQVYVPARSICKDCLGQLDEWVEVNTRGTLMTYTVCNVENPIQPMEAPIIYGIVQLDGADTGLVHILGEVDPEELRIGMRVQAVFKDEREASILDIKYFKPLA
ncbi:MAG: Zn-ribbon domain-containing OB-fold protein [Dehalococcoidia bacterium]|nr:MAG: Zn-ribbon domain-containing OB-fold protein [Dehalococcoidia bacterium]